MKMGAKNVKDVELEFSRKLDNLLSNILQDLGYSLPQSHQVKTSLLDSHGRKKRSNAAADNWSPVMGRIEIRFEPVVPEEKELNFQVPKTAAKQPMGNAGKLPKDMTDAEADLLKALDRAESRRGWSFVPLKKFRDEILPQEHLLSSANTDVHLRALLESVISKNFVLVGKVPNPKSPQFPVTTIRLNRLRPEVKTVLGQNGSSDLDFHPVEIAGEPLSATILRERR
jgi:hypothetical protein